MAYGGGERVHLDILRAFSTEKHITFITNSSKNDFYFQEFHHSTQLVSLADYKSLRYNWFAKKLAEFINNKGVEVVFGSNAYFLHNVAKYLNDKVKIIDLIHSFCKIDKNPLHMYSLPIAHKFHKRIVLGRNGALDFKNLYQKHNLPTELNDRIVIIPNMVETYDPMPEKPLQLPIKVILACRNSLEKRIELFVAIAKRAFELQLPIVFNLFCDLPSTQSTANLSILPPLLQKELDLQYAQSDILLMTSWYEGMPMVVLEAMAKGCAIIAAPSGEIPDLIDDGVNGFIVEDKSLANHTIHTTKEQSVQNSQEFIENTVAKLKLLSENLELLRQMQANSYQKVKQFNWSTFQKNYRNTFFAD